MMTTSKFKFYKGVWIRPNVRADSDMVKESLRNYEHFRFNENSRVLDLGANIGSFGRMVLDAGVMPQNYVAYEPDPKNVELLKLNTHPEIVLRQAVATMSKQDSVVFYQTESGNGPCSGTACPPTNQSKSMRKLRYDVLNEYLPEVINRFRPTHLKIDIEGAEHDWLMENEFTFPLHVREIALELHRTETIEVAEKLWPRIQSEFEVVALRPNDGFIKPDSKTWSFPNLGIEGKGVLFGVDIFLRRK